MLLFLSCNQTFRSIEEKFDTLSNLDYSDFENIRIVNRKGVYFVNYQNNALKIQYSFFKKRIISIEKAYTSKDTEINLSVNDKKIIENALHAFIEMDILILFVDDRANVFISISWSDYCTYNFLKLSNANSLKDIEKQYYQQYKDMWYLHKECSTPGVSRKERKR